VTDPLSASQVQKLGDRLRKSESPSPDDRELLHGVLLAHEPAMTEVARALDEELGLANTTRLKTEGTLLDKLRREKSNLARVDDIAGVRIHAVADRIEQDEVVARIAAPFPEHEVKDRRANPSHGYRAVHVIVRVGGRRVEVQIRTRLQDAWAQIVERFADSWAAAFATATHLRHPPFATLFKSSKNSEISFRSSSRSSSTFPQPLVFVSPSQAN
jgi:ppGpp synthetase/RelA/SpoT-type nucleotidyltranferase